VAVNGATLALAAILTVLVGLGCSLLPIRRFQAGSVAPLLRSGGRTATGGRDRQRARQILVVAQVALAFALLAGSGLLARTFRELRSVRPGFNLSNVLALRVALPASTYRRAADVARFYQRVGERLTALPGVRAAGAASTVPLRPGGAGNNSLWVEDHPDADIARSNVDVVFTSGDYFRALGIPVLAGRTLDRLDPDRALDEVVISASLARREWSDPTGQAAIGRRVRLAPTIPWMTVGAAGVALLLGIVGIYGVVAYTVSLRSREIGVRLALGARPIEVDLMLVRQGMLLAGLGIAAGMVLTLLLTGSLRALLFGVGPNDPLTLGLVAAVLGGATLLATWVPARRAGRVDPALVLAAEGSRWACRPGLPVPRPAACFGNASAPMAPPGAGIASRGPA